MSIEARAKLLIEQLRIPQRELESKSGISQQVWSKALNGKQRLNSNHLEFLCKEYSDYALWLMTGLNNLGLTPAGAKFIEVFEPLAKKFAESMAELEYVMELEKYLTAIEEEDVFDSPTSSPMPSVRKLKFAEIEHQLISRDLNEFIKKNRSTPEDDLENAAQIYFFEKAFNVLQQNQDEYGKEHKILIITGRMLGEFLIPGSRSNVMEAME
ncbi:helix-turn-helix domain-containing protein [Cellvibrio sp. QJXJ]|uniref:helix-turn-helix domain-containing protein n=1 Tax=Cellvibrio sp. QJXJ TaxID=2964606 RepID=UPI0021C3E247|nr:helix-turn-helix transcriptional regulator [Cellvibrio sp. QJXJ]UUA71130.1 helix-turn-helix domain-containing protein [Cellvibrio sp. QJXJ]